MFRVCVCVCKCWCNVIIWVNWFSMKYVVLFVLVIVL